MKLYIHKSLNISPTAIKNLLKHYKLTKNIYIKPGDVDNILRFKVDKGILFIIREDKDPIKQIKLILSKYGEAEPLEQDYQTYSE